MEHNLDKTFKELGQWALYLSLINAVCRLLKFSWYVPFDMDLFIIGIGIGLGLQYLYRRYWQEYNHSVK